MLFQDLQLAIVDRLNSASLFSQFAGMVFAENSPKERTNNVRVLTSNLIAEALQSVGMAICVSVCEAKGSGEDSGLLDVSTTICFFENVTQNDLGTGTRIEAQTFGESALGILLGWGAGEEWQPFRDFDLHQSAVGDSLLIWELSMTTSTRIDTRQEVIADELSNEVTH